MDITEGFNSRDEVIEYCTTMCGAATCDSLSKTTFEKFQDKHQCDRNSFHGYINLSELRGGQVQSGRLRESGRSRTILNDLFSRIGRSWMEVDGPFLETAQFQSFGQSSLTSMDRPVLVFWTVQFNLHRPSSFSLLDSPV